LREVFFKLGDLRSQHPLPAFHGGLNGLGQGFAQAAALGLKIDEGDGLSHATPQWLRSRF
jgi:hypothetical protein